MIIAIDTGGTKTLIGLFSSAGELLRTVEFPTPKDTAEYLQAVEKKLRAEFARELASGEIQAISIAAPGIIQNGTVLWAKNLGWENFDLKLELARIFPQIPILLENDANLAGLYEAQNFRARNVLYLTFSTGVGSGFTTNGELNFGLLQSEVGQIPVNFNGEITTWEEVASARAIVELYGKFVSEISADETEKWQAIAERISLGILTVIPIFQPDFIVFGGSLGAQFTNYQAKLEAIIAQNLPTHIKKPQLVLAKEPKNAVIYGCFELARRSLE